MNHAFEIVPFNIDSTGVVVNLPEIRDMVIAGISNINQKPKTDEEFGQAVLDIKKMKEAEEVALSAKIKVLESATIIQKQLAAIDDVIGLIRPARLDLEKAVKIKTEEVKEEIITEALALFDLPEATARARFGAGLAAAMKGKRTPESMRDALRVYATSQMAIITKARAMVEEFEGANGPELTTDFQTLQFMTPEALAIELQRRIEAVKAAAERKRLEAENAVAKSDAARAQAQVAQAAAPVDPRNPHNLPPPPKIGTIPVGAKKAATPAEELEAFMDALTAAFAGAKAAKATMTHPKAIAAADAFAGAISKPWIQLNETLNDMKGESAQ